MLLNPNDPLTSLNQFSKAGNCILQLTVLIYILCLESFLQMSVNFGIFLENCDVEDCVVGNCCVLVDCDVGNCGVLVNRDVGNCVVRVDHDVGN